MATHVSDHPHAGSGAGRPSGGLRTVIRRPWAAEALWTIGTMVIGGLVAIWVLQLWDLHLHIPMNLSGDGLAGVASVKGLVQHGWYFTNPSVGAPFGAEAYDYGAFDADNVQWLGIKLLSFGISDPAALLNVYYLLGYPLVAGVSYLALRALGVSRPTAMFGGVLFMALPYHWERNSGHLFLGDYFAVPGACWLVLQTLTGRPILTPAEGRAGLRRWLRPSAAAVALVCIAAGGSTLYYAVFTIMLVGLAAVLRAVAARSWRAGIPGALAALAVGVVLVVNISPALIYQHQHGRPAGVAVRQAAESELYSTSLTQMLLPIQDHRLAPLARLAEKHRSTTFFAGEPGQAMGLLFALGFVSLLVLLAARALRGPPAILSPRRSLAGAAAVAGGLAFLLATFGGLSDLFAYIVSPQIRAWNRLTPYMAFFALIPLVLLLDAGRERLPARGGERRPAFRIVVPVVLVALGVIGILDQTSRAVIPSYESARIAWTNTARFTSSIEANVPKDSMILQLPFHPYPEAGGVNGMGDYDEFGGYATSRGTLRWSYGAMKGRPADWTDEAATRPLPWVLRAATAAGFAGVYIDRAAYTDHGQAVEATVRRVLGGHPAVVGSDDGRLVFYSALPLRAEQATQLSAAQRGALGNALVRPVDVEYDSGAFDQEQGADGVPFRWLGPDATIAVANPGPQTSGVFTATAAAGVGTMTITVPGQAPKVVRFSNGQEKVRIPLTLPARGSVKLTFRNDVPRQGAPPEARDLRVQLFRAQFEAAS